MIIKIRRYTLKPKMRDTEHENVVHWMRAFESEEARQAIKDAFYDGPIRAYDVEPVISDTKL